jgi:hypothetical protein
MAALSKRDIEMIFRAETDAAQRPVNELSSDVKRLRQSLEDLVKSSSKTDKSFDALTSTTRELEKAQQELGTARTLLTQLNAQASAVERAEAAVEKATKKYQDLKTQVEASETPTKRLTTSLAAAERGLTANNARLDEARKNYADVKGSIEGIIGPVDNLQDAFRTVAVAQREITQGLAVAKGSVAGFKAEIAETKVEADRLAQVDAFRKIAADSMAAGTAAERIKTSNEGATTSAQRLVDAIQGLVNPAAAAAGTLEGMDARLDAVVQKMSGGKITVNEWAHLNNELQSIQANLIKASAEVDKFTSQQSRVDDAAGAYDRQAQKVRELAAAEVSASTNVEELTADIRREEAALQSLGVALDRETAKLREMGGALQRVGVDANNLPAAIQRIENSARRAAPAIQKVSSVLRPGGKGAFLGLDPFQLQNLSYQVNDVFTGLASGQPPFQVFAQQAGQIVQIFPGIISGFARWLPLIAPVAVAIGVLAGAISEANTQLKILRTANTVLSSLGETNGYDAATFKQIVADFRAIGVSAEEAMESAKTFVKEGLNPAAVNDYVIAAKNLADVQGIDVKTATEELTKAFTSGADEVIKLDDKYHFLTDTQRENLIASKDTKDEYGEVNKAFTALYGKMQDAAEDSRGPFTEAANSLRIAWRELLEVFADTGAIDTINDKISKAIIGFGFLINVAKRFVAQQSQNAGKRLDDPTRDNSSVFATAWQDSLDQLAASRRSTTRAQQSPGADAGAGSRGRQREREEDAEKARKDAEKAGKKAAREAEAEAKRRKRQAEQLARQYENEQDQLSAALSRATAQAMRGTQAPLQQQLELAQQAVDEQFKALEDRLAEFRAKFGADAKINGMSQTDYASALAAQKQQLALNKQLGVYESNINDLLKSRNERLKAIKESQDAGLLSAQQALDKTAEVTSDMGPQIDAAVQAARRFIAALTPSAETRALLDKFDRIQAQSSGPQGQQTVVRAQAQAGLDSEEQKLNDIFQRRASLIEAANRLYDIGAINFSDKEARIKSAYESTNGALKEQILLLQQYLEANRNLFPPEVYERAIADLQAYNAELRHTDTLTRAVKQSAEQAIAGGIMTMFDTLAQGIANIITGAGSLKDLFSNLGRAALSFAATFAKAIADAIIQIYALRIAKSLIGGFHGGGTVGDYGSGQMKLSRNVGMPDLSGVPRYHNGTQGAGLKSNEMLAVLEKGEKVTTKEQQRLEKNRLAAAEKGGGSLRQVLAFGDDQVAAAMQGNAGERTTVTHIRRNVPMIKQLLKD